MKYEKKKYSLYYYWYLHDVQSNKMKIWRPIWVTMQLFKCSQEKRFCSGNLKQHIIVGSSKQEQRDFIRTCTRSSLLTQPSVELH